MESEICRKFHNNPDINPRTGKRLIYGKGPYLKLVKECGPPPVLPKKSQIDESKFVSKLTTSSPKRSSPISQQKEEALPNLPEDVIFREIVMNNPDISNIGRFCTINKQFQKLCKDDEFWRGLYEKYYGNSGIYEVIIRENRFVSYYELFKLCFSLAKIFALEPLDPEYTKSEIIKNYTMKDLYLDTSLSFEKRGLREIPPEIGDLINLTDLYLGHNKIKEIPSTIGKLINLQELRLNNNRIENIPSEIGNLIKLKTLDLRHNRIKKITPEI